MPVRAVDLELVEQRKLDVEVAEQNSLISSFVPGSCRQTGCTETQVTTRPLSLYFW